MVSVFADGDGKYGTHDKYIVWNAMLDKLACSLSYIHQASLSRKYHKLTSLVWNSLSQKINDKVFKHLPEEQNVRLNALNFKQMSLGLTAVDTTHFITPLKRFSENEKLVKIFSTHKRTSDEMIPLSAIIHNVWKS